MGLLASHKALRSMPFRKRKRNSYTHKLNKLRSISSFSSTGDPPATPFNSTTFLMELQQLRELEEKSPCQLKFDQYGSMDNLLACWPLPEPPPNDGYDTIHEDILFPSSSPRARSVDHHAMREHGVTGSSCDSIVRKTHCSSEDVLSSSSIHLCCGDISSLHSFTLERQMEGYETLYCSSDQLDG